MSNLLRLLRKLLRRNKGLITIGTFFLALWMTGLIGSLDFTSVYYKIEKAENSPKIEQDAIEALNKNQWQVQLISEYLCGVQTEVKTFHSIEEMEEWVIQYKDQWDKVIKEGAGFKLLKKVPNDLSPVCKKDGYFGITEDHVLTIFEGPPAQNKVIQTFFRIDTERLESMLPMEELLTLKKGIRIHNVEEYRSVLSTYKQFAAE